MKFDMCPKTSLDEARLDEEESTVKNVDEKSKIQLVYSIMASENTYIINAYY